MTLLRRWRIIRVRCKRRPPQVEKAILQPQVFVGQFLPGKFGNGRTAASDSG